ncbi:unnamed protein product [Parnassius apollo]|uniref:(apollo) hypothetical protein n=1 Tax=Parnassius apollo TaxID=110799 RepID=A0A8S3WCG1_PARAO|nr:unnamed protein product [Parnassius apollo]
MGKLHQIHTSISCSFSLLLTGLLYVWPSYTLEQFKDSHTKLLKAPMTDVESSLLGSLPPLGAIIGTALTGVVIEKFGRQKGGMLLTLPFVVSWAMVDFSSTSTMILIGRFIGGIGCGPSFVYGPMFISEIAEKSIRGTLASVPIAFNCMGVQMSYILGWYLTYRYIVWVNLACSILGMALLMTVTESPVYLLRQNREEDARLAIAHYRGESPESKIVLEELSQLKQQITPAVELIAMNIEYNTKSEEAEKEKLNTDDDSPKIKTRMSPLKLLFLSPSSRRGFIVVGLCLLLQVLMGVLPVQVYAKQIFTQAAPSLSSNFCCVMLAMVLLVGSLSSLVAADKFGRKFLLVTSSILVALCVSSMGIFLQTGIVPPWVTAVLILVYCFFFMFGAGSIPFVLIGECFMPEVQSLATILLLELSWLFNFFILGVFPFMVKYIGIHGSFYTFACCAVFDSLICYFLVPETKGLTRDQIQEKLLRRKK